MNKKREEKEQKALCNYIKLQYPKAPFNSDAAGVRLTMGQAIQAKLLRSGPGFPDFVLYVRRLGFGALFLELKKEGTIVYKKNGEIRKNDHLKQQSERIEQLIENGYFAAFCVGFDNAKKAVDCYLMNDRPGLLEACEIGNDERGLYLAF